MTDDEIKEAIKNRLLRWGTFLALEKAVPQVMIALRAPVEEGNVVISTHEGMDDKTLGDLLEGAANMIRSHRYELP